MNSVLKKHWPRKWHKTPWLSQGPSTTEAYHNSSGLHIPSDEAGMDILPGRTNRSTRVLHTDNQFLRKTRILTDMFPSATKSQSFTIVVTIGGIFLFLTMAVTAAVMIFCKKKNTVFVMQKTEPESTFEMEDMETSDNCSTKEGESELEVTSFQPRKPSWITKKCGELVRGSVHQPLVPVTMVHEVDITPTHHFTKSSRSTEYQPMVGGTHSQRSNSIDSYNSNSDLSDEESFHKYLSKNARVYYKVAAVSSDVDSDDTGCKRFDSPIHKKYLTDTFKAASNDKWHETMPNRQNKCVCNCHRTCRPQPCHSSSPTQYLQEQTESDTAESVTTSKPKRGLVVVLPLSQKSNDSSDRKRKRRIKRTTVDVAAGENVTVADIKTNSYRNHAYIEPDRSSI